MPTRTKYRRKAAPAPQLRATELMRITCKFDGKCWCGEHKNYADETVYWKIGLPYTVAEKCYAAWRTWVRKTMAEQNANWTPEVKPPSQEALARSEAMRARFNKI